MQSHSISYRAPPRRPVHGFLTPLPAVCFTLTLATDILYWQTANLMWLNFSSWLLLAGVVTGLLAALAAAVAALLGRRDELRGRMWYGLGGLLVLALGFVNGLVHAADGWTAVVPWGLTLSALTVIAVVGVAWLDRDLAERGTAHA